MDYFECAAPAGDGRCSDNACPCPEVEIPRGGGYLFISQDLVDFRRQYPGEEQASAAMEARLRGAGFSGGFYSIGPVLVCERGAKLRNLDLTVAAADAAHWWATGKVPLRATPGAGGQSAAAETRPQSERVSEATTTVLVEEPMRVVSPLGASTACECGATLPSDAPICESCGRARGWDPVVLAKEDTFTDLTCPQCPDILIPAKAVYLLHILGRTINCPLCEGELKANADSSPKWQLPPQLIGKAPESEEALLAEVKRLHEAAKNKTTPEHLAETRTVPIEKQLAGRHLVHWLERHKPVSDAVANALIENWLGHFTLAMLTTDGFPTLTQQQLQGFYVLMHYGSSLVHQVDQRNFEVRVGQGTRGLLIHNLMTSYDDWKNAKFNELSYDGRLAIEEAVFSIRAEYLANPGDAKKNAVLQQEMQILDLTPKPAEARGCRRGAGGRLSSPASGCFVATACYGDYDAPEVVLLRQFRDTCLLRSPITLALVKCYYKIGPHLAAHLRRHPSLIPEVRRRLTKAVRCLEKHGLAGTD